MTRRSECDKHGLSSRDCEPQPMAAFHCAGDIEQVNCAWQFLCREWLPAGRYQPADLPAMEIFVKSPEEIGWETFDLQLCVAVVQL